MGRIVTVELAFCHLSSLDNDSARLAPAQVVLFQTRTPWLQGLKLGRTTSASVMEHPARGKALDTEVGEWNT